MSGTWAGWIDLVASCGMYGIACCVAHLYGINDRCFHAPGTECACSPGSVIRILYIRIVFNINKSGENWRLLCADFVGQLLIFAAMAIDQLPALESILVEQLTITSEYLEREVLVDAYLPRNILRTEDMSLLLFNDGQDLLKMPFDAMLDTALSNGKIRPLMCLGIHCGEDRKNEYGTAYRQDFKGRGAKAGLYSKFIFDELLPQVRRQYNIPNVKDKAFAGFSLGALNALDIVWNNASEFTRVGVFSGSLWWRRKAYDEGYDDETDRIMHLQVRKGTFHPWLRFFFQCGTADETADRNKNGVIDSIDDTLDLMFELRTKGYTDDHLHYLEIEGGKHDVDTWKEALPAFLEWGWGVSKLNG